MEKFEQAGLQVVGVSYDSVEVLKKFAEQREIGFPLLSDPDSKVIDAYGVLNEQAQGRQKGVPEPGIFVIDKQGTVRAWLPGTVVQRPTTDALLEAAAKLK